MTLRFEYRVQDTLIDFCSQWTQLAVADSTGGVGTY